MFVWQRYPLLFRGRLRVLYQLGRWPLPSGMNQPPQEHPWICDACGADTPKRVWTRDGIVVTCTVCGQVRRYPLPTTPPKPR
jgi:hypothetical protein